MKSKKLIVTLAMAISIGLGVTAYAANAEATNNTTTCTQQRVGLSKVTGVKGYNYGESVLKDKLGMTDNEISTGFNSGKTIYDMAKEKGMSEADFKKALLEEKSNAIDEAVSAGNITKAEGDSMKAKIESNSQNCIGIPGSKKGSMSKSNSRCLANS
ncbi:hypothetical protein [Clostridium sp. HBUAS56017]|uniref:hypothetical protein n=1 Tax=Clostridium sp. HBUAS56017 TaxID=2571128 RepID=UPI0011780156|nr:hypothetical protein [Clostridium sp. HBUAS56017]